MKGSEYNLEAKKAVTRENFRCQQMLESIDYKDPAGSTTYWGMPLVYDSGTSCGMTPFHGDFIHYKKVQIPVKDIRHTNYIVGVGTVMYKVKATNWDILYVSGIAYHMEEATICLHSPQTYFQVYSGHVSESGNKFTMHLPRHDSSRVQHHIEFPINKEGSNIPMMFNVSCTAKEFAEFGKHMRSAMAEHALNFTQSSLMSSWYPQFDDFDETNSNFDYLFEHFSCAGGHDVTSDFGSNLSNGQKEL